MASAAEQLAAHMNFGAFAKATELKKRIWFTLGALIVYRLGTYIPLPGIDPAAISDIFARQSGGILGMFNMFAGGALGRMTIFALNIMPYISASIIMQLMTAVLPSLEALKKEGETGRKKINQYTRYLTVLITAGQAYGLAVGLEVMHSSVGSAVIEPGLFFRMTTVITLVGGTMFLMWLWVAPARCPRLSSSPSSSSSSPSSTSSCSSNERSAGSSFSIRNGRWACA